MERKSAKENESKKLDFNILEDINIDNHEEIH
jgi:hypothetical protein